MTPSTVRKLNQLNHQFYETISQEFSQTRQQPWDGWQKLIPFIKELPKEISVLDVGCGNGRFLTFLQHTFPNKVIKYTGIDNSEKLLNIAHATFETDQTFQKGDIVNEQWKKELNEKFNLVVSFGVLHHIPGFSQRKHFLKQCLDVTKDNGMAVITAWQFADQEKWKNRFIPFPQIGLQSTEVEENDFLIDWQRGKNAVRYCHHITQKELNDLLNNFSKYSTNFFLADGKTGQDNVYLVIQKNEDTSQTPTSNC